MINRAAPDMGRQTIALAVVQRTPPDMGRQTVGRKEAPTALAMVQGMVRRAGQDVASEKGGTLRRTAMVRIAIAVVTAQVMIQWINTPTLSEGL